MHMRRQESKKCVDWIVQGIVDRCFVAIDESARYFNQNMQETRALELQVESASVNEVIDTTDNSIINSECSSLECDVYVDAELSHAQQLLRQLIEEKYTYQRKCREYLDAVRTLTDAEDHGQYQWLREEIVAFLQKQPQRMQQIRDLNRKLNHLYLHLQNADGVTFE
ncbi:hypothetical protein RFI_11811 [Reticulomyxa filosa]|uniref:Uncharacterized protein n=1 Tax=Reticulomyxa filosa TaxID=46433 RepID=X6NG69_RETFI|nr:hypothetical protein RFI_11811 [Reticulomyxa filosa]|eukprot:ETO25325.1 hypothetical protein RFI_11811 [Reticulomyxa filosa]